MAIIDIKGDIFKTECDVIAHGVNCRGGFNSGIAGQIKKLYPKVREEYLKYHENVGWVLGDVQLVGVDNKVIVNCATQDDYGRENKLYADYNAIERVCRKLRFYCLSNNKTLALPRIGCGLANGDWQVVKGIYSKVFDETEVKVYFI